MKSIYSFCRIQPATKLISPSTVIIFAHPWRQAKFSVQYLPFNLPARERSGSCFRLLQRGKGSLKNSKNNVTLERFFLVTIKIFLVSFSERLGVLSLQIYDYRILYLLLQNLSVQVTVHEATDIQSLHDKEVFVVMAVYDFNPLIPGGNKKVTHT